MQNRDEMVATLKEQLDRWNADVTRWEGQAKAATAEARKRYAEDLKALQARREEALYNLKLLENASASAWSEFARGAEEAAVRMREAVAKARTHFEKKA